MKKGWEIKKLGDVCEFKSGTTIDSKLEKTEGEIIYAKVGDMNLPNNEHFINVSSRYVNLNEINSNQIIPVGSIIFPKRGGAIATNKKRRIIKSTIVDLNTMALIPSKIIDKDYLFFWFQQIDLADLSNGTSIPQINNYSFNDIYIPLPPLSIQAEIVSILEETFDAIAQVKANAEQNLKNAKALFESYLQSVFENKGEGWEEKKVKDVAKHSLGKMLDKNKNKGILQKYLRNQSVRWFEFDLGDLTEMLFLENEHEKYTAIKGDVMICEGGYPGRAAIWEEDYPIYFQKAIHRVRFHNSIYNKWFVYFLYFSDKTGKLKTHFSGTGIQHFTGDALGKFIIPIPPPKDTVKLIAKIESLSTETKRLETLYQQKLKDMEEFKKAVLAKAFNGELRR